MTINIDFDGTCVTHNFPEIGEDIGAIPVLKKLIENGHKLILFTMRADRKVKGATMDSTILDVTGKFLTNAIRWFKENDIPLYGIQKDPNQHHWTTSPKSYAPLMIDDSALGCPLKFDETISDRTFADWNAIEQWLILNKLIK